MQEDEGCKRSALRSEEGKMAEMMAPAPTTQFFFSAFRTRSTILWRSNSAQKSASAEFKVALFAMNMRDQVINRCRHAISHDQGLISHRMGKLSYICCCSFLLITWLPSQIYELLGINLSHELFDSLYNTQNMKKSNTNSEASCLQICYPTMKQISQFCLIGGHDPHT